MNKFQEALDRVVDVCTVPYLGKRPIDVCCLSLDTLQELIDKATVLRPINEWYEELGDCLWWMLPISEPPYVGSPLDDDFPSYVTHFTQLVNLDWRYEDER